MKVEFDSFSAEFEINPEPMMDLESFLKNRNNKEYIKKKLLSMNLIFPSFSYNMNIRQPVREESYFILDDLWEKFKYSYKVSI